MIERHSHNKAFRTFVSTLVACCIAGVVPAQRAPTTTFSDTIRGKSVVLPVVELASFLTFLNVYDRYAYANEIQDGKKVYSTTLRTTWDHLRRQRWVHDPDPFNVNQFGHPYQGATMYGIGRSTGQSTPGTGSLPPP